MMANSAAGTPEPLRPLLFRILLLLNERPLHGYGVMKEVNERAGRNVVLGPGTLYRTLREMREDDLIEEVEEGDDRRRVYRLTDRGREVARAEATRLAALVERARAGDLLG